MKKTITGACAAGIVILASVVSLVGHHSLANYNTDTAVRIKGAVVMFSQINPHSVIFVDATGADGQVQRWAVEGPGLLQLRRMGVDKDLLKAGDVIEACGYVTKAEVQRTLNTEPISLSLKATTPKSVSGKVIEGEQVVLPNGEKRLWSDYGHHKCLDPGYTDFHNR